MRNRLRLNALVRLFSPAVVVHLQSDRNYVIHDLHVVCA